MARPAFISNSFCLKCKARQNCRKQCLQLELHLKFLEGYQRESQYIEGCEKATTESFKEYGAAQERSIDELHKRGGDWLSSDVDMKCRDSYHASTEEDLLGQGQTIGSSIWINAAPEYLTLEEHSLPHLTPEENRIRYCFEVLGHRHSKIAEIMKIDAVTVRKIYSRTVEKVNLGTQGMAEKYPGRYSRKYVIVKPGQIRAAALEMTKKAKSHK